MEFPLKAKYKVGDILLHKSRKGKIEITGRSKTEYTMKLSGNGKEVIRDIPIDYTDTHPDWYLNTKLHKVLA